MSDFVVGVEDKYPKALLENRLSIEGNVCGALFKDILLLDDASLTKDSFLTKDGRFFFCLASLMQKKGIKNVDEVSVLSNASEDVIARLDEMGGYDVISNIANIINLNNWDSYLNTLHKENTIIKLYDDGFNLTKKIEINGKMVEPLKLFRKFHDSQEITEFYESRMASYSSGYSSTILEEENLDIDDEFIDSCEEGVENGVPFDQCGLMVDGKECKLFPRLSSDMNGLMPGTTTILGAYSSTGKSTLWANILMGLMHNGCKVLVISNEQKAKPFKTQFLVSILARHFNYYSLTKKKLTSGTFSEEDKRMIKKAQDYWRSHYYGKIKFISLPDSNMALVKKKMRESILRDGYDVMLYDTLKIDFNERADRKEYLQLIQDSRDLDYIAKKYNVIMLASLQLAMNTKGKLFLDSSCLSMSKQIVEVLEGLLLMRVLYAEEMDPHSSEYIDPFNLVRDPKTSKWTKETVKLSKDDVYRVLFIEKNRNGQNSSDSGEAYILKFYGEHGVFKEFCKCRPKHGYIT